MSFLFRWPTRLVLATLTLVLFLDLAGVHVLKSPLYIPEARQPAAFPRPGKIGRVQRKSYPAYRSAVIRKPHADQNQMFRKLFQHIKRNDIAMTAPVEMTYGRGGQESMAFLYSDASVGTLGWDGDVEVVDVPAAEVISVAIRGAYSQDRFETAVRDLETWLDEHPNWSAAAKPRYLGFNSPFIPRFFRLGEVQISIESKSPSTSE